MHFSKIVSFNKNGTMIQLSSSSKTTDLQYFFEQFFVLSSKYTLSAPIHMQCNDTSLLPQLCLKIFSQWKYLGNLLVAQFNVKTSLLKKRYTY